MSQDQATSSLSNYLDSIGEQPTLSNTAPVDEGDIADTNMIYDGTGGAPLIAWDPSNEDTAQQDPTQVLFHEYDHVYYGLGAMNPNSTSMPTTATATLDGVVYTYSLAPVLDSQGNGVTSPGWDGYQHMLIHNDLIANYGFDDTGALLSALTEANNAVSPTQAQQMASSDAATSATFSWRPTAPPSDNNQCGNLAATTRRSAQGDSKVLVHSGSFGLRYK